MAIWSVGAALIDRMGLSGEFEIYDKILYKEKFLSGVLKNNTELLALVDKGFNAISYQERAEIEARWIPDPAKRYYKTSNIIQLTPAEEAWLRNHKTIRVGMSPIFPPLKFSEKGVIKGIEPDYLNILSEYTGIQFEYVICDFTVIDAKVKSGEIDIFISFNIPERLTYMTFTEPLMDFKQVIIARTDAPFMSGIGALKGKKIATVRGVKLYDKLLSPYPEIEVVPVDTMEEMFRAVSEFKADALISRTYIAGYVMQNYPDLKIAGIADLPPEPYYYAVRKDYPELVGILNKAIASIPRDKHDAIVQKWFSVRLEYRPNWSEILKWAIVIGGVFTLILGLSLFWNRRLAREIDKRKQAEEELLASQFLLNEMGKMAKVGGWEIDAKTLEVRWTEETYRIHEIPLGQKPSLKEAINYFHPEEREKLSDSIQRALKYGEAYDMEIRFITAKGKHLWTRTICVPQVVDGKTVRLKGTFQDITDRKRAEEALRLSEENFRRSLDDSPLGMRIATIEGETIYANRAVLDINGYDSIEELKATPVVNLYTPESFSEYQIRREKRKRGNNILSEYDISIVRKDGEVRHLHVFRKEILWDGERQFQVIYHDITERKRAEEALEKSERKLTDIVEFLPDATFVIDLEGKVIAWNRAMEEMTGISKKDMIGQGDYAYTVPFYGVRRPQLLDLIDISDRDLESKYEYVQRKGNTLYAEAFTPALYGGKGAYVFATATPLFDAQGIRVGAIESIRNITERKKAEEELKNTYEQVRSLASRLQEVREETRTSLSHDIHDELGGALAALKMDLLRLESIASGEEDGEKRQAMLDIIHGTKELINDTIRSTRRIIMEQRPSVLDDFGLAAAIEWQLGEYKTHTGISFEFNVGQIEIDIDKNFATVVFRVFQEASANVIRHSKATEVYISLRVDEGQLILEIKDNGRGITEDELTGTGSIGILGMRERALALGGEINIAGESGKGTTLNLKIPIQ
jgi:PAS domain S-box-containing protein